jgi:phosphate starvation-inducible protein PhoH
VVRHKLVADIVDAYERFDARQESQSSQRITAARSRRTGGRDR